MVEEGVGVDGAKQWIHALPTGVEIFAIEIGVEVADAIERSTCRATFHETIWAKYVTDQSQPVTIVFEQVHIWIVQFRAVHDRSVEGKGVLSIELVILEAQIIERPKQCLDKCQNFRIGGV